MNKVILIGRLGGDPQMRYTPSGQAVTSFSLAISAETKAREGQPEPKPMWARVSVFGDQAEACNKYLTKGRQVCVEGRLGYDATTGNPKLFTRNDGSTGTSFEVTAGRVEFLGSAPERSEEPVAEGISPDDEIPF